MAQKLCGFMYGIIGVGSERPATESAPLLKGKEMSADAALDLNAIVITPENIQFEYRLAGPFRRLPAFLLDLFVRAAVLAALIIFFFCSGITRLLPGLDVFGGILLALSYFFFDWFYGLFFETIWNGQTPGKRISGLRVLSTDGRPISAYQATIRNFLRLGDFAPFASLQMLISEAPAVYWVPTGGVAILCMFLTRRLQRLGDLAAGTMVVVDERKWVPPKLTLNEPAIDALVPAIAPNFRMSRTMLRTVAMYVERRSRVLPQRRRELAAILTKEIIDKLGVAATTDPDLLLCALYKREYDAQWKGDTISDKPIGSDKPTGKEFESYLASASRGNG